MNLLSIYITRTILKSTIVVLMALLALAGLFEFIGQLDALEGDYTISGALIFSLLRIPQLCFEIVPIGALIGSLLGLGSLANSSELVVMRTAGISMARLSGMVALSGLLIMVFTALIGEFIAPPLDYFARNMRDEARYDQTSYAVGNGAWVKDGSRILHLEKINTEFEFGALYLFRFNDDDSLESIARAENSGIYNDDNWVLEDVKETRFFDDSVQVAESSVAVETFDMNAEMLGITLVKPISLSARGLMSYINYLKKNSLNSQRYETEFWSRIARTVTVVLMPILALAFVFGSLRSSGSGSRILVGVMIGLGYFLASEMTANSGQVFDLDPALVTWLPSIAFFAITILALSRVR